MAKRKKFQATKPIHHALGALNRLLEPFGLKADSVKFIHRGTEVAYHRKRPERMEIFANGDGYRFLVSHPAIGGQRRIFADPRLGTANFE